MNIEYIIHKHTHTYIGVLKCSWPNNSEPCNIHLISCIPPETQNTWYIVFQVCFNSSKNLKRKIILFLARLRTFQQPFTVYT